MASFSIECHITLQCPTSVSMIWYVEVAVVSQLSLSVGESGRVSVLQAHHLTGLVEQSHRCLVVLMVGLKKKEKKGFRHKNTISTKIFFALPDDFTEKI